ncbi:MAG: MFS transporter, partial [Exiguobacterium mexicanum]
MNKASAFVIYSIVFFAFFDLFAQLPVMSTFATSVGATPFIAGLVIAIYSLSNTFGNILSGIWTDRIGPIVILFVGLGLSSLSLLSYHLV